MTADGFFRRSLDAMTEADSRLLARFRIAHGLAMAMYVAYTPLFGRLDAFFTDEGVVSLEALRALEPLHASVTLFRFVHTHDQALVAFSVGAAICLAYAAGAFTRVTSLLAYLFVVSIHHRAVFAVNGGMLFMHDLFLPVFLLPLGRHLSVDAWLAARRGRPRPPIRVRSLAMLLLHLQIFVVYFFNVVHKTGDTWYSGTAVRLVLVNAQFAWPIGIRVGQSAPSWLIALFTYGTLVAELAIALAVISPFRRAACRRFAAFAIPCIHLGFGALLNVGPFFLALAPVSFLLLASEDAGATDPPPVIEPRIGLARGLRLGRELVGVGLLLLFLAINRRDEGAFRYLFGDARYPRAFENVATVLFVKQKWSMFSADPPFEQRLVMPVVELEDGRVVDVRTRQEPDFERVDGRELQVDYYWQLVDTRIASTTNPVFLQSVARYFARRPEVERWPGERRVREVGIHILYATLPIPGRRAERELHSTLRYLKRMRPRDEPGQVFR